MALLGVIVVVVCALLTLVFALLGYSTLWKASAYCMVVIPVIIYVMMWLAKLLENRGNKRYRSTVCSFLLFILIASKEAKRKHSPPQITYSHSSHI